VGAQRKGAAPGDGACPEEMEGHWGKPAQLQGGTIPPCITGVTLCCDTGHR